MRRRSAFRVPIAFAMLLVAFARPGPARAEGDGWLEFRPPTGEFRVVMPNEPTAGRMESWFPISKFVSTVYTARVGDDAFGVNHTDMPRVALFFASRRRILESARKGFVEDARGTERSWEETEFDGRPARELRYDIPPLDGRAALRGRARMFFVGRRLYMFWAEVTERVTAEEMERFFASIRIEKRD